MDEQLKLYLDAMKAELKDLKEDNQALRAELKENIHGMETKLLHAFDGWARSMEIRVRTSGLAISGMDERIAWAEERISELERRKDRAA